MGREKRGAVLRGGAMRTRDNLYGGSRPGPNMYAVAELAGQGNVVPAVK